MKNKQSISCGTSKGFKIKNKDTRVFNFHKQFIPKLKKRLKKDDPTNIPSVKQNLVPKESNHKIPSKEWSLKKPLNLKFQYISEYLYCS